MIAARKLDPIPPGEMLLEEFMKPNGVSQNRLARESGINPADLTDILSGRAPITVSIAHGLAKYFGTTPELWLNLQISYKLRKKRQRRAGARQGADQIPGGDCAPRPHACDRHRRKSNRRGAPSKIKKNPAGPANRDSEAEV